MAATVNPWDARVLNQHSWKLRGAGENIEGHFNFTVTTAVKAFQP
jgi:hypothetical protein